MVSLLLDWHIVYRDPFQTDILIQEGYACNLLFNNSLPFIQL